MIIDCHAHIAATRPNQGYVGPKMRKGWIWKVLDKRYGLSANPERADQLIAESYQEVVNGTKGSLDAAVTLAFDAIYTEKGVLDPRTSYIVYNQYVESLVKKSSNLLYGASIHPYRKDAVAELERAANAGAVLVKWLPPVQGIDPDSILCEPFYEAMADLKMPLLCHTGSEHTLPRIAMRADILSPKLLTRALKRGVTVICAHAGSSSWLFEKDYSGDFWQVAQDYERCYGDTAAMSMPWRFKKMMRLLEHPVLSQKMLHGSDYPVFALPTPGAMKWSDCLRTLREPNLMLRDCLIKQAIGPDEAYWHRAGQVLRLPNLAV